MLQDLATQQSPLADSPVQMRLRQTGGRGAGDPRRASTPVMPPSGAAQESNYQPRKSSFITGYPQNGAGGMDQAMALEGPKMVRWGGELPSGHCLNVCVCLQSPEIRKYKRKFSSEILCGALWGVNLLVGTDGGLMLLDRSGHGKVFQLINRRRFQQIEVLEGLNILVCISGERQVSFHVQLIWQQPSFSVC